MRMVRDNPGICDDLVNPERPRFWLNGGDRLTHARGFKWADANQMFSGCFTILPPNDVYCGRHNSNHLSGTAPMSSRHVGGAHVLMADGAVIFITDSIEAGNRNHGDVWRNGMGNRQPGSESPSWTVGSAWDSRQQRNDRGTTEPISPADSECSTSFALASETRRRFAAVLSTQLQPWILYRSISNLKTCELL